MVLEDSQAPGLKSVFVGEPSGAHTRHTLPLRSYEAIAILSLESRVPGCASFSGSPALPEALFAPESSEDAQGVVK